MARSEMLLHKASAAVERWPEFGATAGVPGETVDKIWNTLRLPVNLPGDYR